MRCVCQQGVTLARLAGGRPVASYACLKEEVQGVAASGCRSVDYPGHLLGLGFRSLSARKEDSDAAAVIGQLISMTRKGNTGA